MGRKPITTEVRQQAYDLHKAGCTYAEIMAVTGLSHGSVGVCVQRPPVKVAEPVIAPPVVSKPSVDNLTQSKIRLFHQHGFTAEQISLYCGVSVRQIREAVD